MFVTKVSNGAISEKRDVKKVHRYKIGSIHCVSIFVRHVQLETQKKVERRWIINVDFFSLADEKNSIAIKYFSLKEDFVYSVILGFKDK